MTVIDPIEIAAELEEWQSFVSTIEATIPFPDSTTADPNIVWADIASGAPKPYGGPVAPSGWPELDFVAPWEGQLGTTAIDPETGIVVPLDLKNAPISPAFYDSATKVWSINPAYLSWAISVGAAQPKPSLVSVPAPDPAVPFRHTGLTPTWADVYQWQSDTARAENASLQGQYAVTGDQVARAIDVAMGTTTKALSGYISGLTETVAWLSRAVRARIDGVQLALYKVAANLNTRLQKVENVQKVIVALAIPNLQAQITAEKHNRQVMILRHEEAVREWVRDNVYVPLNTDIQANQIEENTKIQVLHDGIPDQVRALAPELIAPVLLATTALATRVAALELESAECVKPMCSTMGPNTDLGKFLKALKIAEWAALILEIANATNKDVDDVLAQIAGYMSTGLEAFESAFVEGGQRLRDVIGAVGG